MQQVTGIILAGGRSRRMGTDKALLPLPGARSITFVEQLAATLAGQCRDVLIVARDPQQAASYEHLLRGQGVAVISDKVQGRGPLMGLYSGLSALDPAKSPHGLVVAVDMPLLQVPLLAYLLALPRSDALQLPVIAGVPQVLCAVYPYALVACIERRLEEGRSDPRSLLEIAPVHYIEESRLREVDPQLLSFINVNTQDDLRGWRIN